MGRRRQCSDWTGFAAVAWEVVLDCGVVDEMLKRKGLERNQRLHSGKEVNCTQLWKTILHDSHIIMKKASKNRNENLHNQAYHSRDADYEKQVEEILLSGKQCFHKHYNHIVDPKSRNMKSKDHNDKSNHSNFLPGGSNSISNNSLQNCQGSIQALLNKQTLNTKLLSNNTKLSPVIGHENHLPTSSDPECHQNNIHNSDFLTMDRFKPDFKFFFLSGT